MRLRKSGDQFRIENHPDLSGWFKRSIITLKIMIYLPTDAP